MTCNAKLFIADDYGDNSAGITCQLERGHEGLHQEVFKRNDKDVTITWELDETCVKCKNELCTVEIEKWRNKDICDDCEDFGPPKKCEKHDDTYWENCYHCEYEIKELKKKIKDMLQESNVNDIQKLLNEVVVEDIIK